MTLSDELGVDLPLPALVEKIYARAQKDERGKQDWTAIFDMLHENHLSAA